jgi:hypothetical protein
VSVAETTKVFSSTTANWKDSLSQKSESNNLRLFYLHERTGRPLGDNAFIGIPESLLKINLKKKKSGRKKKEK